MSKQTLGTELILLTLTVNLMVAPSHDAVVRTYTHLFHHYASGFASYHIHCVFKSV